MTGDGPTALFTAAVAWLHQRRVLLSGLTVLARLVASCREAASQQLGEALSGLINRTRWSAWRS
ncbi:DUF4158 domain-containing protein [Actinopolyspora mortivallis]|uniref:DUF4158 domain-containing protein n=1 Tax=Actinopolyspora mortivallis TaxID=33906 RepID=UPI0012EE72FF